MMTSWIDSLNAGVTPWFEMLCRSSWQIGLYVLIVFGVCRAFPKIPGSVRCALWWLACLKLLIGMVWVAPIKVPVLPAMRNHPSEAQTMPKPVAAAEPYNLIALPAGKSTSPLKSSSTSDATVTSAPVAAHPVLPWILILIAAWGAGLIWRVTVLARQFGAARKLADASHYIEGTWIREAGERLARRIGLSYIPPIRASTDVSSPVVVGLREPVILVPLDGVYSCDNDSLRIALAHEMAHVRRNDLWLGLVPTLAQALFFFHPLAWLAGREYSLAREEACDAEAIRLTGIAPHEYGRLLLKFGVAGRVSGAVVGMGASINSRLLKRRLEMLRYSTLLSSRATRGYLLVFVAVASLGVVPVRLIAKEVAVTHHAASAQPPIDNAVADSDPVRYTFSQLNPVPVNIKPVIAYPLLSNAIPIPEPPTAPSPAIVRPAVPNVAPAPLAVPAHPPAPAVPPSPAAPKATCSSEDTNDDDATAAADDVAGSKDNDNSDNDISNVVSDTVSNAVNQAMVTVNSTLNHLQILQDPDTKGSVLSDKVKEEIKQAEQQSVDSRVIEQQARQSAIDALSQSLKSLEAEQKEYQQDLKGLHDQYPSTESEGALQDYMLSQQAKKQALDQAIKSIRRSLDRMRSDQGTHSRPAKSSANFDIRPGYSDVASADSGLLKVDGSDLVGFHWSSQSQPVDGREPVVEASPEVIVEDGNDIGDTTEVVITLNS